MADIANYLYEHPKAVDLKLKGVWITDPSVSYDIVTEYIPALTFAEVQRLHLYTMCQTEPGSFI